MFPGCLPKHKNEIGGLSTKMKAWKDDVSLC